MPNQFSQLFSGLAPKTNTPKFKFIQNYGTSNAMTGYPGSTPRPTPTGPMSVQPKQSTIAANTGATAPVAPKNTALATPAAKQFVANQVSSLQPNVSYGSLSPQAQIPQTPTIPQPITGNTQTPSGATIDASSGALINPAPIDPKQSYRDAFASYMASLNPSAAETAASKNLADLTLQAQKDQEEALNRGETQGAALGEAQRVNRNNQFGIDAASNALNAFSANRTATTDAQKARVDFEKSMLDSDSEDAKTKFSQDLATQDQKLATQKFEEDKKEFGLQYALDAQKANEPKPLTAAQETAQIAQNDNETAAQQSATQSIGLINGLLTDDRYKAISGAVQTGSIPFLGDRAAVNEYDQLQGLLKLGIRGLLKGQGAVSDYEGKVLGQAASSLSRLTNESQMQDALKKVRGVLKTNNGQDTDVIVKDKDGKTIGKGMLNGQDIYDAINDGNTVVYQ